MDPGRTVTVVLSDGVVTKPLDHGWEASDNLLPGPGRDLLVSGELNGEYGVHRLSESPADGGLQRSAVLDIPWVPSRTSSLALFQGRLDTADTYVDNVTAYHERKLVVSGTPSVITRENLGDADSRQAAVRCLTGDGRVLYQTVYEGKAVLRLVDKTQPTPGTTIDTGLTGLSVESVSGRYVAYRTATATVVRDLDSGAVVRTASAAPAALWGATLWQSAGAGKVTATDVRTGTASLDAVRGHLVHPVVRAGHRPVRVCGVRRRQGHCLLGEPRRRTVRGWPTGAGLLGDGFVVRVGADRQVTLTDVTSATPATRAPGTARGTTAGTDWTVDVYGGQVRARLCGRERVRRSPTASPSGRSA